MKVKYLKDLITPDQLVNPDTIGDILIKNIAYDSRNVNKDCLFVAIKGYETDGHQYLQNAYERGAVAAIVETKNPQVDLPQFEVNNTREMLASLAEKFFSPEVKMMRLAGITGTNGKTTTSYLVRSIFESAGLKSGMIGTIHYLIGEKKVQAWNTTPESVDLFRMIYEMSLNGQKGCILEASSHGLALHRLDNLAFEVAVFTNLSQDHLDFHQNFEDYFLAKKQLFSLLKPGARAVINKDDSYGKRLMAELDMDIIDFSTKDEAKIKALSSDFSIKGTEIEIESPQGRITIKSHLIGSFNVENILAAVAAGIAMNFDLDTIKSGIECVHNVPGRLEPVNIDPEKTIIVDYSHTPDALQKALMVLNPLTEKKLWVVFGCGGDRDKIKRPMMGKIAQEFADRIIITSDNPRREPPASIIQDILGGVSESEDIVVEEDRRNAIHMALTYSERGDTILIAGKGHEDYQEIQGVKYPFDDRQVVREFAA